MTRTLHERNLMGKTIPDDARELFTPRPIREWDDPVALRNLVDKREGPPEKAFTRDFVMWCHEELAPGFCGMNRSCDDEAHALFFVEFEKLFLRSPRVHECAWHFGQREFFRRGGGRPCDDGLCYPQTGDMDHR